MHVEAHWPRDRRLNLLRTGLLASGLPEARLYSPYPTIIETPARCWLCNAHDGSLFGLRLPAVASEYPRIRACSGLGCSTSHTVVSFQKFTVLMLISVSPPYKFVDSLSLPGASLTSHLNSDPRANGLARLRPSPDSIAPL